MAGWKMLQDILDREEPAMRANVIIFKPDGTAVYIHDRGLTAHLDGLRRKVRASVIEPCWWPLRLAFGVIRSFAHDESPVAAWTRTWRCLWRVRVIGGPILDGEWRDRAAAIAAEVAWLEERL